MKLINFKNKVSFGTAQFGQRYGITNKNKLSFKETKKIFNYLKKKKFLNIDTAYDYKNSYNILSKFDLSNFKIGTKIPDKLLIEKNPEEQFKSFIKETIKKLKISKIDYILIHNPEKYPLSKVEKAFNLLLSLKAMFPIRKIGCSIYEMEYLNKILRKFNPELVQFPLNLFDTNFALKKNLKIMDDHGIEKHARSIFLQGILLQNFEDLNDYFKKWSNIWSKYYLWLDHSNMTKLEANLSFLMSKNIDRIIIGINSLNHLQEIVNTRVKKIKTPSFRTKNKKSLIKPTLWKI